MSVKSSTIQSVLTALLLLLSVLALIAFLHMLLATGIIGGRCFKFSSLTGPIPPGSTVRWHFRLPLS